MYLRINSNPNLLCRQQKTFGMNLVSPAPNEGTTDETPRMVSHPSFNRHIEVHATFDIYCGNAIETLQGTKNYLNKNLFSLNVIIVLPSFKEDLLVCCLL